MLLAVLGLGVGGGGRGRDHPHLRTGNQERTLVGSQQEGSYSPGQKTGDQTLLDVDSRMNRNGQRGDNRGREIGCGKIALEVKEPG